MILKLERGGLYLIMQNIILCVWIKRKDCQGSEGFCKIIHQKLFRLKVCWEKGPGNFVFLNNVSHNTGLSF